MSSSGIKRILDCLCDTSSCIEKSHIKWDRTSQDFVHSRIDGCVSTSSNEKKCDCLIMYSPSRVNRTYVFIVEVKRANYNIGEVIEQLLSCRNKFNLASRNIGAHLLNVNTIRSMLPAPYQTNKGMARLVCRSLSNIRQENYDLIPVLCAKRKIRLLQRVGYTHRFKLKIGSRKSIPIGFVKSGEDILTRFRN